MKKDLIKAIAIFGITAAATIIITRLRRKTLASGHSQTDQFANKRVPHGRNTVVKRRALEALHSIEH